MKNPYVGLRPFDIEESYLFFGRDEQTLELLQRLHQHSFVAVVGSSGSGKSSLLRAGLIPALNGGFLVNNNDVWKVAITKPGQHPLFNMARAILEQIKDPVSENEVQILQKAIEAHGAIAIIEFIKAYRGNEHFNFFLLIDQFEEVFRFSMTHGDSSRRVAAIDFVDVFLELANQKVIPFYVVLTMRSDFIGDCSQFYGLPEAMNRSQYLVPRLTREQLRKVIEGPAMLYGGKFDSALTSLLLNRLGNFQTGKQARVREATGIMQDELPVLQHALMRIWNYETTEDKNQLLDLKDYEMIGGLERALSDHADEAFLELTEDDQIIASELFKGLTTIDENGRKVRRPALLSELTGLTETSANHLQNIIEHFVRNNRSFLVVNNLGDSGDKLIDISHESLIRQWGKLDQWVDEESEKAKIYDRLLNAAHEHASGSKGLLDVLELRKFKDWMDYDEPNAVWARRYGDEREYELAIRYIHMSRSAQLRKRSRRQFLIGTGVVLLLAAVTTFITRNIHERNKDNAFRLHENAQIQKTKDPTKALLLEMAAYNIQDNQKYKDSAEAIYKGEGSFYRIKDRKAAVSVSNAKDKLVQELISPSYDRIMAKYASGKVVLWDLNGDPLLTIDSANINAMQFSNDGSLCAVGKSNGEIHVWTTGDAKTVWKRTHPDDTTGITSIAFSAGNELLVAGNEQGNVSMWDKNGKPLYNRDLTDATEYSVSILKFAPNDSRVFGSSFLNSVVFTEDSSIELTTGKYDESGLLNAAAFHPTEDYLVTGGKDRNVRVWDIDKNISKTFPGHKSEVVFVEFLIVKTTTLVVSAGLDNTILLWDMEGNLLQSFMGHQDRITSIRLNEAGTSIITKSLDLYTKEWPLNTGTLQVAYENGRGIDSAAYKRMLEKSPPSLPLDQFLSSGEVETLSPALKNEYGIK
ncbi:MAG: hypothetical protein AAF466_03955 [Bacteroidota bacterium]